MGRATSRIGAGLAALLLAGPSPAAHAGTGIFGEAPIGDGMLGTMNGRENLSVVASNQQAGSVVGNSITGNSTTGTASVGGNAFQNAQGMTLVTINSGNNVSINAALSVSVLINPAK